MSGTSGNLRSIWWNGVLCERTDARKTERDSSDRKNQLFQGLPGTFPAARYHSLAALKEKLPEELKVTAESEDGEVMAVEHTKYPIYGVQFHPESVMTPDGKIMIENFIDVVRGGREQ